jgi:putative NADH-flavin reductase
MIKMKILIFGASGATGHELVKQALMQGHVVTAFVRSLSKLAITHPNLEVFHGDVGNYLLVEKAVRNQDAVISALGASNPFKYDQSVVDGIGNIIRAMEKNGISRFIYMSFAGVSDSRNNAGFVIKYIAPKILGAEITGHEAREDMIGQSHLKWIIVRPPTLTNGKHRAQFRSGENISSKGFIVTISRADVADFMLRQLTDNHFSRKKPMVFY